MADLSRAVEDAHTKKKRPAISPEVREQRRKNAYRVHELMRNRRLAPDFVPRSKTAGKVAGKDLDTIKDEIPRMVYEALALSLDTMLTYLHSRDPKVRTAAAEVMVDKLGDASFLKNVALIREEAERAKAEKGEREEKKVEWDAAPPAVEPEPAPEAEVKGED